MPEHSMSNLAMSISWVQIPSRIHGIWGLRYLDLMDLGMGDGSPAKYRARNVRSYARLGYVLHTTV